MPSLSEAWVAEHRAMADALWQCLMLSGADVSDYTYETATPEGIERGRIEFTLRGDWGDAVSAVATLRALWDQACAEEWARTRQAAVVEQNGSS